MGRLDNRVRMGSLRRCRLESRWSRRGANPRRHWHPHLLDIAARWKCFPQLGHFRPVHCGIIRRGGCGRHGGLHVTRRRRSTGSVVWDPDYGYGQGQFVAVSSSYIRDPTTVWIHIGVLRTAERRWEGSFRRPQAIRRRRSPVFPSIDAMYRWSWCPRMAKPANHKGASIKAPRRR